MTVLVSVHKVCGTGLTQEVEGLLRYNPLKWFTLADVMDCVRRNTTRGEVNSVLCKMVKDKGTAEIRRELLVSRAGATRLINMYRWRV